MVVFGLGLAYFAWTAVNGPIGVPLDSPTPNAGQAATQFQAVGFYLKVDGVERTAGIARIQVTFTNKSSRQQRADPQDFLLSGSAPQQHPFFNNTGCPNWGRVDLYAPSDNGEPLRDPEGTRAGAVWGPSTLCFQDPGGSLTLIWEPDVAFGPLSEPIRIPLR